jgi:hypothetical protein
MNILTIYEQCKIPENLQLHMLRVAAVGKIICDHSSIQSIDSNLIIKTLLLHDMGNIIKFNFSNTSMFSQEDRAKVDSYKTTQAEFMRKYGNDADVATIQIIKEITSDERIIELCKNCHGEMAHKYVNGEFWNERISYYADMRSGLNGILSVDQRFDDLKNRYPDELEKLEDYHIACKKIEARIQDMCGQDLQMLDDAMLESEFDALKRVEI